MNEPPLQSLVTYSRCVAEALNRPTVQRSTVAVWSASPYTGIAEGEVWFLRGLRLRLREELDFEARLITSYGYEERGARVYGVREFCGVRSCLRLTF
jgi:hypothetical protein